MEDTNFFTNLWTLKLSDWQRGLIVAVFTAPLTIIYQSVTTTPITLVFDWKAIVGAALAGGIAYILKNLATGSGGNLLRNG
jgi:hypothetical protein